MLSVCSCQACYTSDPNFIHTGRWSLWRVWFVAVQMLLPSPKIQTRYYLIVVNIRESSSYDKNLHTEFPAQSPSHGTRHHPSEMGYFTSQCVFLQDGVIDQSANIYCTVAWDCRWLLTCITSLSVHGTWAVTRNPTPPVMLTVDDRQGVAYAFWDNVHYHQSLHS